MEYKSGALSSSEISVSKNEEVESLVSTLSGGERARLSLAVIAAQSLGVLILDEVTNNLDLTTRRYLIDVISAYPGMLIVVSHDEDFLSQLDITGRFVVRQARVFLDMNE